MAMDHQDCDVPFGLWSSSLANKQVNEVIVACKSINWFLYVCRMKSLAANMS